MSYYIHGKAKGILSLILIVAFSFSFNNVFAQDGAALFKANCASCHKPDADFSGPALKGWADRAPDEEWIYKWIANPAAMIASGDAHAKALFEQWKPTTMTGFPQLSKEEVDAIMTYVDEYVPPVKDAATGGGGGGGDSTNSTILYGILTLVLAIIAFALFQINKNLQRVSDEKERIRRAAPLPFYKNKTYIMAGILAMALVGGYLLVEGGIGLGRQQNYEPKQPIFFSHEVHAGVNQISCLYCHTGAQTSKQSGIPPVNVCMNCHMAVKEYTGELELKRKDGSTVDGTSEIKKLHAYAGWSTANHAYNPDNNGDGVPDGAKPIPWVKIHNLPDHVYFNHSQHVNVGKQQCQTCHGNITQMPEVYQFSDLSMGWCINCHRETKVDFYNAEDSSGNKFYSIYQKFHQDLKDKKMDSVTVESIGGTECQKCHY